MSFASSMKYAGLCLAAALTLAVAPLAGAQVSDASVVVTVPAKNAPVLITDRVDMSKQVPLKSADFLDTKGAQDLGPAPADMKMSLQLELRRSAEQQRAVAEYKREAFDPSSKSFGKTMTPADFASKFGLAQSDLDTIKDTLTASGFTLGNVDNGRLTINFSGTVEQVNAALVTSIHLFQDSDGNSHYAPVGGWTVPSALFHAVGGINGLDNFSVPQIRSFDGPVTDFAPGTTDEMTPLSKIPAKDAALHMDGELLHDFSFTASSAATVFSTHTPTILNVRIGGGDFPATGSLTIKDETGKTLAFIKDITTCEGYNNGYGRSCTGQFKPETSKMSQLTATYSGDSNYRAVTQRTIHPDAGTTPTIVSVTDTPVSYFATSAVTSVFTATVSWTAAGAAPTTTLEVLDTTKGYIFGGATLPVAPATTSSGSSPVTPHSGTATYACTSYTWYVTCAITTTAAPTSFYYAEDEPYEVEYIGNGTYAASTFGTEAYYGDDTAAEVPTVSPTLTATGSLSPGTQVYGNATYQTTSLSMTGSGVTEAFGLEGSFFASQGGANIGQTISADASCTTATSCTFSNTMNIPAVTAPGTYTLTYVYSGNSLAAKYYGSATATGTSTLTVSQQTPTFGPAFATPGSVISGTSTAVTLTANLAYTGTGAVPATTGSSVPTFVLNSVTYNAACTGTSSPLTCTASVPPATIAALSAGSYSITASYPGDINYTSATATAGTLTVGNDSSSLTATPVSTLYGSATTVSLVDTITVTSGGSAPTGTITFTNSSGVTAIATVNASTCVAGTVGTTTPYTCSYTWTPPYTVNGDNAGSYVVTAAYSGDGNYTAGSGSTTFTITKATSTTTLSNPIVATSASPSPTATVTTSYTGTGIPPTGTVQIINTGNAAPIAQAVYPAAGQTSSSGSGTIGGQAYSYTCSNTTALSVTCNITLTGLYTYLGAGASGYYATVEAVYGGDSNYGASTSGTSTASASFGYALATDTLTASPASVVYGSGTSVTYTTTLTGTSGDGALEGTTYYSSTYSLSGTAITGAPLSIAINTTSGTPCTYSHTYGPITCTKSVVVPATTPVGTYPVTQTYSGNIEYAAASATCSTTGCITVTQATLTSLTLSAATPGTSTAPVTGTTLTATVAPAIAGLTVTFTDAANGFTTTAVTNASGVATTPTITGTTAGLNNITASIAAGNTTAATSNTVPVYIGGILYTTTGLHDFSTDPGTTDGTKLGPYGVTVYNFTSSAQPLTFSFTNAASGAFSYVTNCPSTIASKASCSVQFYYAPPFGDGNSTTVGEYESASWNIAPNAGVLTGIGDSGFDRSGATTLPGTLAGKALLATASLSVSPLSYSFGSQAAGTTSNTESIVVTNNFGTPVAFTYTGPTTSEFTASSNCVSPLAGNSTCKINVTFSGSTPATYSDSIVITPSGGSAITSSMTGTIASNSGLTISSTSHSFGNVTDGTTATFGFSITNNSGASATVGVSYPTATGYTVSTNCGTTLAAAAVCNVNVTFAPTTVATLTDAITVSSSVPVLPGGTGSGPYSDVVSVTGNGVAGGSFTASSVNHNFGNVPVGTSAGIYGVELSNNTSATITLSLGAGFTNGANGFTIVATNCGSSLAVNANCELQFSFEPTATGAVTASYGISPNVTSGGSTYSAITLSGNGQ